MGWAPTIYSHNSHQNNSAFQSKLNGTCCQKGLLQVDAVMAADSLEGGVPGGSVGHVRGGVGRFFPSKWLHEQKRPPCR
ncbi:MAG: hypothetical protein H7836_00835 [Magnetococcus sp. YQC-3]